jgi:hypothetical protein
MSIEWLDNRFHGSSRCGLVGKGNARDTKPSLDRIHIGVIVNSMRVCERCRSFKDVEGSMQNRDIRFGGVGKKEKVSKERFPHANYLLDTGAFT